MSRRSASDPNVMIRVEGMVDAKLLNVLAVFYEVDLWKLWVPSIPIMGLRTATMLEDYSAIKFTVHMVVNIPWPIATRDMMIRVQGVDCMDTSETDDDPGSARQVVVLLNSTDSFWKGGDVPGPGNSDVRMDVDIGALILTPQAINGGGTGTHLSIITRINPKLDYIPTSLINVASKYSESVPRPHPRICIAFVVGVARLHTRISPPHLTCAMVRFPSSSVSPSIGLVCWLFFDRLKKQAGSVEGTEYADRIASGKRFYAYIKEKMAAINYPEENC
jgi:hypothetical protein